MSLNICNLTVNEKDLIINWLEGFIKKINHTCRGCTIVVFGPTDLEVLLGLPNTANFTPLNLAVTACTTKFNRISPLCRASLSVYAVWTSENSAIISLYSINGIIFVTDGVSHAVRNKSLSIVQFKFRIQGMHKDISTQHMMKKITSTSATKFGLQC